MVIFGGDDFFGRSENHLQDFVLLLEALHQAGK